MLNEKKYLNSDFARDALIIVANDTTLCEDYEYYNRLIDYLAERLNSELNSERWERERLEREKQQTELCNQGDTCSENTTDDLPL